MDSDVSLGRIWITAAWPSHAGHASSKRQRFQTRGGFPIQGRYTLFGTGVRRQRSLHLLSRNSSLHDCETRDSWAGHELHSSPTPLEIRVTPVYSHWRASGRHPRSSIERAACALGHFLGRRRSQWAAPGFGSREEQSRADLQSSRSGTAVRLPQSTGLVRSADVAMANGDDRVLGRICLTSFCWAS